MESRDFNDIQRKLRNSLDTARYEHTIGVMYTAGCLAMAYGYDMDRAMLAGLLHDCAKCIPHDKQLVICQEHGMEITAFELANKLLLHAKTGAILAKEEYNITDSEILHAIKVHTTGEPDMNTLDKIIYIADYIEPSRNQAPNLEYIRRLAYEELDACVAKIAYDTLSYLQTKSQTIDPMTEVTYRFYEQYRKESK